MAPKRGHGERRIKVKPLLITLLPIPFITLYFYARILTFFSAGYSPGDLVLSSLLFCADLFFAVHTLTYLANFYRATEVYGTTIERYFKKYTPGFDVAVLVTSYNEPQEVIDRTLSACAVTIDYAGYGRLYLLDDSTDPKARAKLEQSAKSNGAKYVHRGNRRGFKAGALNDALKEIDAKYFTVIDADQRPVPEYLAETVTILEEDETLAFVQVPQKYMNTDASRLALAAQSVQQVFFDYITEGKSVINSMFSCGSNTVFRTRAVKEVGGFDETSVTEDMATSIKLHEAGWRSKYYNRPLVQGEGPTTLGAYFTQQARWSLGSMGLCLRVVKHAFTRPRSMTPLQWWDYFVTTTWYFVGWVYAIMIAGVLGFAYLGLTPIITATPRYFLALIPYVGFNMLAFTLSTVYRGNELKSVLLNISLTFITIPVYMVSAVYAILNRKRPFQVTPKNLVGGKLPYSALKPQLLMLALIAGGILAASYKAALTGNASYALDIVWMAYYLFLGMFLFYYNTDTKRSAIYDEAFRVQSATARRETSTTSQLATTFSQAHRSGSPRPPAGMTLQAGAHPTSQTSSKHSPNSAKPEASEGCVRVPSFTMVFRLGGTPVNRAPDTR
ncbi:MAG: glycosyltransferase [Thermoprotei archaeon]